MAHRKTIDPTRTSLLRASFAREMRRRLTALADAVYELVGEEDAFSLGGPKTLEALVNTRVPDDVPIASINIGGGVQVDLPLYPVARRLRSHGGFRDLSYEGQLKVVGRQAIWNAGEKEVWRFQTNDEKLKSFNKWLGEAVDKKVLSEDPQTGEPWTSKYVGGAYKRGVSRATSDALRTGTRSGRSRAQVEADVMRTATREGKLKLLASRSLEDLKGITQQAATKMNKLLVSAMVNGDNPRKVAREMQKAITGLSKSRAERIARTEIIHAHAEGQLDSFEELGIKEVGVMAEWSTAGDDEVCPLCEPLEGAVFTVAQARGMLPRHPNCRCSWVPSIDTSEKERRATPGKLKKSLEAQGGPDRSSWVGKLRLRAAELYRKRGTPPKKVKKGGKK